MGVVFTFVLKDAVPPSPAEDEDTMEESSISYETTFSPGGAGEKVYLPFSKFEAMYRGRTKVDAPPVNLANIKRFSLMVRR